MTTCTSLPPTSYPNDDAECICYALDIAAKTLASIITLLTTPSAKPLSVKLRCKSWEQVEHLYERDIKQGQLFLKASRRPPLNTRFDISLGLPSDSTLVLHGRVSEHIPEGGYGGKGPGVILRLDTLPYTAQWLIESSLKAAFKGKKRPAKSPEAKRTGSTPSVNEGKEITAAEEELVATLRSELAALKGLNPFQLLNVDYRASDDDVRSAFGKLTKRYHPDRFARYQNEEVRSVGTEIYLLLRNAYKALATSQARKRTLAVSIAKRSETPVVRPAPKAAPAATTAPPSDSDSQVDKLLAASKYDAALKLAKVAARRAPSDRNARAMLELCEGLLALAQGDRMEAAERLEASLELSPDNEHAVRGLAEIRRRVTDERKGFLGRLLQKKD